MKILLFGYNRKLYNERIGFYEINGYLTFLRFLKYFIKFRERKKKRDKMFVKININMFKKHNPDDDLPF